MLQSLIPLLSPVKCRRDGPIYYIFNMPTGLGLRLRLADIISISANTYMIIYLIYII